MEERKVEDIYIEAESFEAFQTVSLRLYLLQFYSLAVDISIMFHFDKAQLAIFYFGSRPTNTVVVNEL